MLIINENFIMSDTSNSTLGCLRHGTYKEFKQAVESEEYSDDYADIDISYNLSETQWYYLATNLPPLVNLMAHDMESALPIVVNYLLKTLPNISKEAAEGIWEYL